MSCVTKQTGDTDYYQLIGQLLNQLRENEAEAILLMGVRTFHPIQFQHMQFQPLTISTHCISTFRNFDLN